jgi:hypothetical protein
MHVYISFLGVGGPTQVANKPAAPANQQRAGVSSYLPAPGSGGSMNTDSVYFAPK